MLVPLIGYAPDIDPVTPGVLVSCSALLPSLKGFEAAPSAASLGIDALAAACQGGAVLTKLDDTTRLFAGSGTKLYERSGTTWTDRTRASGGNYGLGGDIRWSFAQFGNVSLAVAKTDILQFSSSGAFANVGASIPKATIVETVGNFVFLFDVDDQGAIGGYGDNPQRWWCCAKGDYTDWTPAIATESATGTLASTPGPIRAGKRFGDSIIAYKEKAMFLGTYVGPPVIWDFREIIGVAGALGQYAVASVGTPENPRHIFMGHDDFYQFDGTRPVPLGVGSVRETVYNELNRSLAYLAIALHDPVKARVFFYYCTGGDVTPDKCVVYNYKTNRWGRDDRTIEMALQYVTAGLAYDDLGASYSTYNDLPSITYDSTFWTARTIIPAVFDTSHVIRSLNGAVGTSAMTTGDYGDDQIMACISRVRPRWVTKPSSASMTNYYRNGSADALTTGATTAMDSSGRFNVLREARWHRLGFSFTGSMELSAISADFEQGGDE